MSTNQTDDRRLESLADALDNAFLDAADEEILADAEAAGHNTVADAARVKAVLLESVQRIQKRNLLAAQTGYKRAVEAFQSHGFHLPETPEKRRRLFELVVAKQPQYAAMYTTQHRDLNDVTDADIESYLEELSALGVLDELIGHGNT